jgi:MFS family permease
MSAIADRSKSFTSRRFAMMLSILAAIAALVNWLPGCTLLCSVIMYVVIGICMIGLAPFLNSMAMALVNKGVPVNYSFGRGIGSAFYAVGAFSMGFCWNGSAHR